MAGKGGDQYKEIGVRIREARIKRKMSQQELAAAANVSLPHISEIELGKSLMRLSTFIRIAEALQVSTDYLIRADVPEVNAIYQKEFQEMVSDCTPSEIDSFFKIIRELKSTMRKHTNDSAE